MLSNHDEVGNARRLYHIVRGHPRGFDIARLVSWFSLLCPGYGLVFQGTEDLAAMEPMLQRLPTTLLVRSNGEADLFA